MSKAWGANFDLRTKKCFKYYGIRYVPFAYYVSIFNTFKNIDHDQKCSDYIGDTSPLYRDDFIERCLF